MLPYAAPAAGLGPVYLMATSELGVRSFAGFAAMAATGVWQLVNTTLHAGVAFGRAAVAAPAALAPVRANAPAATTVAAA